MSSQHSQLSIIPGIGRREEPESPDSGYEPTIGLKAVAKILNCSAEQCRRLAEAKKIPVFRMGYPLLTVLAAECPNAGVRLQLRDSDKTRPFLKFLRTACLSKALE
jgi:hypothetical protein